MKIYVASDMHIGHADANYPKILKFFKLAEENADLIVLLGDILDEWVCDYTDITRLSPMKECYEAILNTAKKVPIIWIWGNHDCDIGKKIKKTPNIAITDSFTRNNIHWCHGWRFDSQQRAGYWLYGWIIELYPSIYQRYFKTPFGVINGEYSPSPYFAKVTLVAKEFAEKNSLKYVVYGHTHDPLVDGKLVNPGDFIDSCSYVIFEDDIPRLMRI